ncbi:hypothetical protein PUNSTDRAFT_131639 [Punctularia strigosozonata HHB-11173 SS5]|uniref:uncharacterized protein n=1 Tax=Punctularia strigosozonata (strain HHB-11173) TaxID=741275 RepID=UPI000441819C|nr:uncharacterized protein PUNSTDRAFT_131639 [Punctularia strigosozonata HHB-11173 SS5]EIN11472.1 hypothetical protein PUNSTDRAFT_131639 [Punctularia strigosozonata HHB-11173 SS5]
MSEAYVNFLGGSPLNRLSWLRTNQPFLNHILAAPATRWLVFRSGQPLLAGRKLARLATADVQSLLGPSPYFGQGQNEGDIADEGVGVLEAARLRGTPIVFLGLQEPEGEAGSALPSSEFSGKAGVEELVKRVRGTPWFSLDVSDVAQEEVDGVLAAAAKEDEATPGGLTFGEPRAAMAVMDAFEAAVFAEARSMADWNARNKFCPACGSCVYSLWAGWKLSCTSLLPWADNTGKQPCPSSKGLHNFAHPRTDPVVIMIAINESNDKILLGRNKKFPGKFYSALAGFMEPGESFEDAVKREMWEEAGVKVWDVRYHSGQPWPYPANLMVGFYATADPSQPIRVDLDNELEGPFFSTILGLSSKLELAWLAEPTDARWYTRDEILAILRHPTGATLSRRDNRDLAKIQEGEPTSTSTAAGTLPNGGDGAGALAHSDPSIKAQEVKPVIAKTEAIDEPPFRVPPLTAIAGVLISEWAHGKIKPEASNAGSGEAKKGNL